MNRDSTSRLRLRWLGGAALSLLLSVTGCNSILEAHDPDIVEDAGSPSGAIGLRNGVIFRFSQAMDGSGDAPDGFFLLGGLMTDEWQSGDTFEQRNTTDWRIVQFTNSFLSTIFRSASRVRNEGQAAINALRRYAPIPVSNTGQMFAFIAFTENQVSEFFCNGIPFSEIDGTTIVYGDPVPYDSGYARAINHADSAAAWSGGDARVTNFALIVKGRALLNRNQPAAAAAVVAPVATTFRYSTYHSINSTDNVLWLQTAATGLKRYVMANNEGTNGLNFRTANDPRIPLGPNVNSFDGLVTNIPTQAIWVDRGDSVAIATGIEARLIEAEAALRASNFGTFIQKLNDARATKTGLTPLTDPGTDAARVDLLFRERAFWLFGTGHRLGDLRRLIRQYGRNAETVFPTGVSTNRGTPYGSDVNFPIPQSEQNNPIDLTAACTDRLP